MFAGFLRRDRLNDLLEASFAMQDGVENDRRVTFSD